MSVAGPSSNANLAVVKLSSLCRNRHIERAYKRVRRAPSPRRIRSPLALERRSMRLTNFIRVVAFAVGAATLTVAQAADISGAGATFPFPIYAKWADSYKKDTGNGLNYQSIGSGAGIKQIKARTVTFGATDAPLEPKELDKAGLAQFPMVMGGIVAVVNLPGVKPGDIVIDGPTLAQIYLGKITSWNDPALKATNPKLDLPNLPIVPIHRDGRSGTTCTFTYYLSQLSPDWKSAVGVATTGDWPGRSGR